MMHAVVENQRRFFESGETRRQSFRRKALKRLRQAVVEHEDRLLDALWSDLNKPAYEGYLTEIGPALSEIRHACKNLHRWSRPRRVWTPLVCQPAVSRIQPEPQGVALILSPWNYPVQLALIPLAAAVAAGNCCVLKASEVAPHSASALAAMIADRFPSEYLTVVEGGVDAARGLLQQKFDTIFFTGSSAVGKQVMAAAAEQLTPVTLELGGKSPCIVEPDVDLATAARRIAAGKFLNAGQTCVAPDYLLVRTGIKAALLDRLAEELQKFYGEDPRKSPDYARIVSDAHFSRLERLLHNCRIRIGGQMLRRERYFAPTVVEGISVDHALMQEEIFGPILPVFAYDHPVEAMDMIRRQPRPLALYLFTNNRRTQQRFLSGLAFGGGCVNDTLMHLVNPRLPFGGTGDSGFGRYHGKAGFEAFSYMKSVMKRPTVLDLKLRYPPYGKLNVLKKLFRYLA
jgi:aldehyde dehydrogenase (NAD+)